MPTSLNGNFRSVDNVTDERTYWKVARSILVVWLWVTLCIVSSPSVPHSATADCLCKNHLAVLTEFYNATGGRAVGGSWKQTWDLSAVDAPCGWYGVSCPSNASGFIDSLILRDNGLTGTLPSSLSELGAGLLKFIVDDNSIGGTLPARYSNWTNLMNFSIRANAISGTLPSEYSAWTQLVYFFVPLNNLSGPLPPAYSAWWKQLNIFEARNNAKINGSLPDVYSVWTAIQILNLGGTAISGQIPAAYANWSKTMLRFTLSGTNTDGNITGTLPPELAAWKLIAYFAVDGNKLTGTLPASYGNWTSIGAFIASSNRINGTLPSEYSAWWFCATFKVDTNQLTGSIPSSYSGFGVYGDIHGMGNFMYVFQVYANSLTHTMPDTLSRWANLVAFDVSYNQLNGTLPASYGNWTKSLDSFYVNNNAFSGSLPASYGQWGSSLLNVYCNKNSLTGSLPASYAAWSGIQKLRFDGNALTGQLPDAYSAWGSSLQVVMFGLNQFTGTLPSSWATAFTAMSTFFVSHNQLQGTVPPAFFQQATYALGFGFNNLSCSLPTTMSASTLFLEVQNNSLLEGNYPPVTVASSCGTRLCGSTLASTILYACLSSSINIADMFATTGRDAVAMLTLLSPYKYSPTTTCAAAASTCPSSTSAPTTPASNTSRSNASAGSAVSIPSSVKTSTSATTYATIAAGGAAGVAASVRGAMPSLQRASTVLALSQRCAQAEAQASSNASASPPDPAFNTPLDNPLMLAISASGSGDTLDYPAGAAVGNVVLVAAVALISHAVHVVILPLLLRASSTAGVAGWRRVLARAVAAVVPSAALPGSVMLAFNVVVQPSIGSSVLLLVSSDRSAWTVVIGSIVLVLWTGSIAWFAVHILVYGKWAARRLSKEHRTTKRSPLTGLLLFTAAEGENQPHHGQRRESLWARQTRRWVRFWLTPQEEWNKLERPERSSLRLRSANGERGWVIRESVGVVIEPYVGRRAWYFAVEWAVAVASGVTSGVALAVTGDSDATSSAVCAAAEWGSWVALALTVVDVGLCLALRPLAVRADFAATVTTGVLGVVAAALALAGDDDGSQAVVTAAAILQLVLTVLLVCGDMFAGKRRHAVQSPEIASSRSSLGTALPDVKQTAHLNQSHEQTSHALIVPAAVVPSPVVALNGAQHNTVVMTNLTKLVGLACQRRKAHSSVALL